MSAKKGFTLIELMVVISIIGILSVMGYASYTQVQKIARDGKRIADIQEIQKALEQYFATNANAYPASLTSINNTNYFPNGTSPIDPTNGAPYTYSYVYQGGSCTSQKYVLCARLEVPGSKANSDIIPADACASLTSAAPLYYCVKSISN